jgi:hypothetical protein
MGGHQHNDDSKVSLMTPPHLLDVIDEQWLEDSLPHDDVDVPSSMRLQHDSAYDFDVATSSSSSSIGHGDPTTGAMHHAGVGVAFSAGGGGGGGSGGARGAGAGFNADDGVGGDEDRNEERWGRGR